MKTNLRITSGEMRGRKLHGAFPEEVRCSSEKLRQAVFNIMGNNLRGITFLDLFSGSGIMGFEALSRSSERVEAVEKNPVLVRLMEQNALKMGLEKERLTITCARVQAFLENAKGKVYDIIYLDPPYIKENAEEVSQKGDPYLESAALIHRNQILSKGGTLIAEFFRNYPPDFSETGFKKVDERIFGTVGISFWKYK